MFRSLYYIHINISFYYGHTTYTNNNVKSSPWSTTFFGKKTNSCISNFQIYYTNSVMNTIFIFVQRYITVVNNFVNKQVIAAVVRWRQKILFIYIVKVESDDIIDTIINHSVHIHEVTPPPHHDLMWKKSKWLQAIIVNNSLNSPPLGVKSII